MSRERFKVLEVWLADDVRWGTAQRSDARWELFITDALNLLVDVRCP
jgi:hypothetical protein